MNDGRRIPKAEPGFATRHTIPEEELEMLPNQLAKKIK